jgi:hypothetical protein
MLLHVDDILCADVEFLLIVRCRTHALFSLLVNLLIKNKSGHRIRLIALADNVCPRGEAIPVSIVVTLPLRTKLFPVTADYLVMRALETDHALELVKQLVLAP